MHWWVAYSMAAFEERQEGRERRGGARRCRLSLLELSDKLPISLYYEKVVYERQSSMMISLFIRQLEHRFIRPQDIVVDIDLCCSDFPFNSVWFIANPAYWQDDLEFEVRS